MQFPIYLNITHRTQINALRLALNFRFDFLDDNIFEDIEQNDGVGQNVVLKELGDKITYNESLIRLTERVNNVSVPGRFRIQNKVQLEHVIAALESYQDMESDSLFEAVPVIQPNAIQQSVELNPTEIKNSRNIIKEGRDRLVGLAHLLGQIACIQQTLVIPESDS